MTTTICELRNHQLLCTETGYRCTVCDREYPLGFFARDGIDCGGQNVQCQCNI